MIRTSIIPQFNDVNIHLTLPDAFIGKEVELTAVLKSEITTNVAIVDKSIIDFKALSIKTKNLKLNREELYGR